jgi:hypothetical protein
MDIELIGERTMFSRLTDNARAVIRTAFRHEPEADLRAVLSALGSRKRWFAASMLSAPGVDLQLLPVGYTPVGRTDLIGDAHDISRSRGEPPVGTEHLLLALARRHDLALATIGASYEQLVELVSAANAEWHRAHPPLPRRLGAWCRRSAQFATGWFRTNKR